LAGDAAATDPVCSLSPMHSVVDEAIQEASFSHISGPQMSGQRTSGTQWVYRIDPV
jgi:hypothetical protein